MVCLLSNAQVQGRPLGVAEASSGGGVPCNAQLGAAVVNGSLAMFGSIGEHFAEEGQFSLWCTWLCESPCRGGGKRNPDRGGKQELWFGDVEDCAEGAEWTQGHCHDCEANKANDHAEHERQQVGPSSFRVETNGDNRWWS